MNKRMGKVSWLLGLAILLFGGMFFSARAYAEETGDWTGAKKAVITAYKKYQTEVDVTEYNLNYKTEYESLKEMMSQVVNETPYLFYAATNFTVSSNRQTNQIVKIGLGYTDDYTMSDGMVDKQKIKNTREKLDAAVNEMLTCVDPRMTKVEKAMILHDYLILNTSYINSKKKQFRLTEVGVFLNHKANCQGYSLAYGILMNKIGIPVRYVKSSGMSHMWNMIKLGGQWYHVDVTWDDPVDANNSKDQYGMVRHNNFLCSSAEMQKNGHSDFDATLAVSKKYDGKYWKNLSSSFFYEDGKWLYMTNEGVTERAKLLGGTKRLVYNVAGTTMVPFKDGKYYFIAFNSIYLYDYGSNSATAVWKASSRYSKEYILTQIKYSNGYVYYKLLNGTNLLSGKLRTKENGTI